MKKLLISIIFLLLLGSGCTYQNETNTKQILKEKNFNNTGLSPQLTNNDEKEHTFLVQIHPKLPLYKFEVHSLTTKSIGYINIFENENNNIKQKIDIDPNFRETEKIAKYFNVQDINFDGYADIGVLAEGGANWGAYQYWIFDQQTENFITTPLTEEFKQIGYNEIEFNKNNKQITAYNLIGAIGNSKKIYQVEDNHLQPIEEYLQENIQNKQNIECLITTKKYKNGKVTQQTETQNQKCPSQKNTSLD